MTYVLVDGRWHEIGEDANLTRCGEDIPYGSDWQRDVPDKTCGQCAKADDNTDDVSDTEPVEVPIEEPVATKATVKATKKA